MLWYRLQAVILHTVNGVLWTVQNAAFHASMFHNLLWFVVWTCDMICIYILYEGLYCIFDIGYILWCVDWTGLYVIVKCRTAHFICQDITQPCVICFFLNVFLLFFVLSCLHVIYALCVCHCIHLTELGRKLFLFVHPRFLYRPKADCK